MPPELTVYKVKSAVPIRRRVCWGYRLWRLTHPRQARALDRIWHRIEQQVLGVE